ncbi:DNA double-strand break repair Rad50 ATPase [Labilithrix luteola]|uniref:DNA double-strand break repair Rad50 ATPase n=1 Tax=Labilithrix luteola TaxID=1391654 RepID=A0A0K1PZ28_9BACT|nr:YhaN family protein [Labilithrix luteola]AKU98656.1 DNA double-strand break repair Rad50 ATPase [Labilithrix luteola]
MRIDQLELLAYGHFQGHKLEFGPNGLHVVFGRNEAGKSTTLRAITGLLYGIAAQTHDDHVHEKKDLRIGGILLGENGERLRVVRRKGNANTLLNDQGQPIDETPLLRMLGGVSQETFRQAFGLDHEALTRGAEALLQGRGDLGESLFDASVGGGGEVQRLLAELTKEADEIYKPRGSTLPLNEALKAFGEAQKQIKERQSLPEAFVTQQRALEETEARRVEASRKRAGLATRRAQLERARSRVPLEQKRAALAASKAPLGDVVRLVERATSLPTRVAQYERDLAARRDLEVERESLRARIADASRRVGGELDPTQIRIDARKEARISRFLQERTALSQKVESAKAEAARSEREVQRLREAMATNVPDTTVLARALAQAQALGDAEARHANNLSKVERKRREIDQRVTALGLFSGTAKELAETTLPAAESIERLLARAAELDRGLARHDERLADLEAQMRESERQIAEQEGEFAPPEPTALRRAREARDELWNRLKKGESNDRLELEAAFERAVREADELADRMIREADRVTTLAKLRASAKVLEKQRLEQLSEREALRASRAALDDEHRALWAPSRIAPLGFAEMKGWLERRRPIVEAFEGLLESDAELADAARDIENARRVLASALDSSDASQSLADLVVAARRRIESAEAAKRVVADATRSMVKLEAQIDERAAAASKDQAALADVCTNLAELVRPLGVPDDASTDEVTHALDALRDLFTLLDKRSDAESRGALVERAAGGFEDDVARLVAELAPDLAAARALDAAVAIVNRADKARQIEQELTSIDARLEELGGAVLPDDVLQLAADADASFAALEEIDAELGETDREIQRLGETVGGIRNGLDMMRRESGAAEASSVAQEALARVRTNVERYCRARLAQVLLSREIERYRQENQGPLLATTSRLFSRLTLGKFSGVRAGFDDRDRASLVCVRATGTEVDVAGLSEGTRDQLYLSLRLASLLRYADIGGPMPLVLDDLLVQFDDERSRAALGVLAEVSSRMQVLFFTHHARLVELAREAVPAPGLHVHEL